MSRTSRVPHALALAAVLAVTAAAVPANAEPAPAGDPATYVVTLTEEPLATNPATKPDPGKKLDTTSAEAKRHRDHLTGRQDEVARSVGAAASGHYSVVSNGFVAQLTPLQVARLNQTPGVVSVAPDGLLQALDDRDSSDFLGLSGANGLWSKLGGTAEAGKGVVVGVVDSGIWPENPSFAGPALGTEPPTQADPYRPYRQGDVTVMKKADGATFTGTCQTGQQFTADLCNQKVISARYYGTTWLAQHDPAAIGEFVSPRDLGGHGSHTASTAAGNNGVAASANGLDFGTVSGVAPGAAIAVYKALWNGQGYISDILHAIDQAVADGVDVINFSVGAGQEAPDVANPTGMAFLRAAAAGVFVAAAGGNSGPGASTIDNTGPWVTTVAAGTIAPRLGDVHLGDGTVLHGASATVQAPFGPEPLATSVAVKTATASDDDASMCGPETLDPAKAAGKIIYCVRGVVPRADKSAEVKRAGGVGMVLGNPSSQDVFADIHGVPTVHVDHPDAAKLIAYAATEGATATLLPVSTGGAPYPQVASFSSRGPSLTNDGNLLKPDISAPGVSILAAVAPPGNQGKDFDFYSGTSMAAPHVAGLAALYLGEHPQMSPASIKSAMMTTAYDTRTADAYAQGAGHVDPARMLKPGLVYDATIKDWYGYLEGFGKVTGTGAAPIATSDLNYPSIAVRQLFGTRTVTRRVTALTPGVYHAKLDLAGYQTKVSPSTLNFKKAGETKEFTVTIKLTPGAAEGTTTSSLTWSGAGTTVRSPVVVTPLSVKAPAEVVGAGTDGTLTLDVTPGVAKFTATGRGLVQGRPMHDTTPAGADLARLIDVTVPEGTKALGIKLSHDPGASVLAALFRRGSDGVVSVVDFIDGSGGDRRLLLAKPEPGAYIVLVASGGSATDFTLQTDIVTADAPVVAPLRVTPAKAHATPGTPLQVTASWSELSGTATGYLEYPNGTGTVVSIN
ncbi:S8 family serine peptidase [Nonomuraea sp. NPDC004297]